MTLPGLSRVFNFIPLLPYFKLRRRNFPPNPHQNIILSPITQFTKKPSKGLFLMEKKYTIKTKPHHTFTDLSSPLQQPITKLTTSNLTTFNTTQPSHLSGLRLMQKKYGKKPSHTTFSSICQPYQSPVKPIIYAK